MMMTVLMMMMMVQQQEEDSDWRMIGWGYLLTNDADCTKH
jgi:hypothetical protein